MVMYDKGGSKPGRVTVGLLNVVALSAKGIGLCGFVVSQETSHLNRNLSVSYRVRTKRRVRKSRLEYSAPVLQVKDSDGADWVVERDLHNAEVPRALL